MMKVCLSGLGRAGVQIANYLRKLPEVKLVAGLCSPGSWKTGLDLGDVADCGNIGVPIYSSDHIESCFFHDRPDVVIDFSTSRSALVNAGIFSGLNVKIVMGTTGFSPEEKEKLFNTVESNGGGLIYAPNITRGVNTLMLLADLATRILDGYDVEIVEMHHKKKADIPSGTAKLLAAELKSANDPQGNLCQQDIPVTAVRAGGIVGYHKVMLVGQNDMIEIAHQTFSRDAFAEGAYSAAQYIQDKTGIYEMKDTMNLDAIIKSYLKRDEPDSPLGKVALV